MRCRYRLLTGQVLLLLRDEVIYRCAGFLDDLQWFHVLFGYKNLVSIKSAIKA